MKIKKINALSFAKIYALTLAIFGFIAGFFMALASFFKVNMPAGASNNSVYAMGVLAVVILPLMYGLMGFIVGWFSAALYNFAVKWVGPVEVDVE